MALNVAVDVGGTFTDLFAYDTETHEVWEAKTLSTPPTFARGVLDAVRKSGVPIHRAKTFVHGSTVAINIAIEQTGARTALVVSRGTRDVYKIGRGNRPDAYNIYFKRPEPLVAPGLTFEIDQRTSAHGEVLTPFNEDQARRVAQQIADAKAEAVAVCFLHSYANTADEVRMGELLASLDNPPYVSLSHDITRKYGEYERISTTVLNSYVGPRSKNYLSNLQELLRAEGFNGRLLIMQSNGGLMALETAQRLPTAMMESGPVGGVAASAYVANNLGFTNSISFDMGGTTAKSSLIHGREPVVADGYFIGGYDHGHPAMLPVVDIVEVGTGGGSIAWADNVGGFNVGPRSAGADPGPICYGQGGTEATITDANVALGRLNNLLGGEMSIDRDGAEKTIATLGEQFGLDGREAALAIIQIAVTHMSLAVRAVSVERGFDPRDFALVAIGGAGPIHATLVARELHAPTVIVPVLPAHFSAFGMLVCDLRHDYFQTFYTPFKNVDIQAVRGAIAELTVQAGEVLASEHVAPSDMSFDVSFELRYEGQEFSIPVPVPDDVLTRDEGFEDKVVARFNELHDRTYGHCAPEEPVEIVGVRMTARGAREGMRITAAKTRQLKEAKDAVTRRPLILLDPQNPVDCPVYLRDHLAPGDRIDGPAVVEEYASSTLLLDGDVLTVAESGELVIQIGESC